MAKASATASMVRTNRTRVTNIGRSPALGSYILSADKREQIENDSQFHLAPVHDPRFGAREHRFGLHNEHRRVVSSIRQPLRTRTPIRIHNRARFATQVACITSAMYALHNDCLTITLLNNNYVTGILGRARQGRGPGGGGRILIHDRYSPLPRHREGLAKSAMTHCASEIV